jgi:hypothetical protein
LSATQKLKKHFVDIDAILNKESIVSSPPHPRPPYLDSSISITPIKEAQKRSHKKSDEGSSALKKRCGDYFDIPSTSMSNSETLLSRQISLERESNCNVCLDYLFCIILNFITSFPAETEEKPFGKRAKGGIGDEALSRISLSSSSRQCRY